MALWLFLLVLSYFSNTLLSKPSPQVTNEPDSVLSVSSWSKTGELSHSFVFGVCGYRNQDQTIYTIGDGYCYNSTSNECEYSNEIYLFNGFNFYSTPTYSIDSNDEFILETPTSKVLINNVIYFVPKWCKKCNHSLSSRLFYKYHLDTFEIEYKSSIPLGRGESALCYDSLNHNIWSVGGSDENDNEISTVQIYNIDDDEWSVFEHDLNIARVAPFCAQYKKKIFTFGGIHSPKIEILDLNDIDTGWVFSDTDLLFNLSYSYGIKLDLDPFPFVFIMGGIQKETNGDNDWSNKIILFDLENNHVRLTEDDSLLPYYTVGGCIAYNTSNEKIYYIGGMDASNIVNGTFRDYIYEMWETQLTFDEVEKGTFDFTIVIVTITALFILSIVFVCIYRQRRKLKQYINNMNSQ